MNLVQTGSEQPLRFISSAPSPGKDEDLLTIAYVRVQNDSPEFLTVYEGINQAVDIQVSTFKFRAAPEPIIALYDFIMATFVPQRAQELTGNNELLLQGNTPGSHAATSGSAEQQQIRVLLKLASVQG